ncbi:TnsA endonuclease N-terminal domain-containing protein [Flavobacterium sp.]|uniref:TnsA endonuclease N-terminal domain-containing protein n=1 Tax=Flavobacterium sp. TaxID=239 RepID=UPI0026065CE2|nr:TnsA endonuclease N-terminal domain-containing protein [Flavobacterium sp.]
MKIKLNKATSIIETWLDKLAKGQYEPLIKVWSGPKGTRRHFFKGMKTNLNHHFLSDGEKRLGLVKEAQPETVSFYEQFPLYDIELCIRLSVEMGIKYPVDEDGEAYLLSTDLLCNEVDFETGEIIKVARTYKPIASFLTETKHPVSITRTLQKLELERLYYKTKGIPFYIETDLNISKTHAENLVWARKSAEYRHEFVHHAEKFTYEFINLAITQPDAHIIELIERTVRKLGISFSDGMALFQWGIWSQLIPADLEKPLHVFEPIVLKEVA